MRHGLSIFHRYSAVRRSGNVDTSTQRQRLRHSARSSAFVKSAFRVASESLNCQLHYGMNFPHRKYGLECDGDPSLDLSQVGAGGYG